MNKLIKNFIVLSLIAIVSLFALFSEEVTGYSRANSSDLIPILTYHHIQNAGTFDEHKMGCLIVTPEQLEEQLTYIKLAGYNTITTQDIFAYYDKKISLPKNPILITFDDGYNSTYQMAFPVLKRLNMKATVFVPVINIRDENNPKTGHASFITWQQAKEMKDSGLIDIQSHSYDLHRKTIIRGKEKSVMTARLINGGKYESNKEYNKRIEADLKKSKELIERHVGNDVIAISFPYGDYNKKCQKISSNLGMKYQFGTAEGVSKLMNSPLVYKRITVDQKYSGEQIIGIIQKYSSVLLFY